MKPQLTLKLIVILLSAFLLLASAATRARVFTQTGAAQAEAKALDPARWGDDHVGKPAPQLAGGDECLFCHRATVGAVWQTDAHFLSVRDKFHEARKQPEIESLESRKDYKKHASEVRFVMGLKYMVRFLRQGDEGRFDLLNVGIDKQPPGKSIRLALVGKRVWDESKFANKCIGCHMTGVDAETLRPFETFVGCESCHGPFDERHTSGSAFMRFSKKAKDSPELIASACGQCHLRGGRSRSTGRPFANNFISGDNLFKDYAFDFSGAEDPKLNPIDAHIQINIRDIVVKGRDDLTCLSCHKMHPASTANHRRRPRSDLCFVCHTTDSYKNRKAYEAHSAVCEY
jgi:predicted CXXCH cytochrome family protein